MVNSANGGAHPGARPAGTGGERPDSAREEAREPYSRIVVRPVGSPLPLGFVGLSGGTFVLAGLQLGWVPAAQSHAVALVLLAFVFPVQALASVLGFLCRDAVAATGMGVLAGTWLAMGAIMASGPPGATSEAAGLLLLLAGLALLIPVTAGGADKLVASVVLVTSSLRFFLTGAYHLSGGTAWKEAAGITGLVLTAVALYAALAFEVEDVRHRAVLPTLRRGSGAGAFDGTSGHQFADVIKEAGVRREL
ncbi:GPR1/FUN34/YaaH family transporter [Streptomyces sp. DH-12]|uniref:GPR1/FUN34/YaaH family transporter n=1 Tax=Streptomyces sp. DH-12 TaxID=2072509 RepID=UPI00237A4979|nr:GPR1/FUN34/YaaH family transporter [Streptomyces sp. DH-12]